MEFPVPIPIGPWTLHPHVVFELAAYSAGFQLFLWLRRRQGDAVRRLRPLLVLAAIAGAFVGAKLLALLEDPARVWADRGSLEAWLEGKTIVGGLLGGLVAVEAAKKALGVWQATGDLYALPLCVGIAIGRVGCFLTGLEDRTHGVATALPWGVDFGDGVARHPTQLYEIAALAVLAALVLRASRRPHREGDLFRLFMAGYLGWRLAVGFLQPGPTLLGLGAIQWACVAGLLYYARDLPRLAGALRSPRPTPEPAHA